MWYGREYAAELGILFEEEEEEPVDQQLTDQQTSNQQTDQQTSTAHLQIDAAMAASIVSAMSDRPITSQSTSSATNSDVSAHPNGTRCRSRGQRSAVCNGVLQTIDPSE